jgi:hypothetical protein
MPNKFHYRILVLQLEDWNALGILHPVTMVWLLVIQFLFIIQDETITEVYITPCHEASRNWRSLQLEDGTYSDLGAFQWSDSYTIARSKLGDSQIIQQSILITAYRNYWMLYCVANASDQTVHIIVRDAYQNLTSSGMQQAD